MRTVVVGLSGALRVVGASYWAGGGSSRWRRCCSPSRLYDVLQRRHSVLRNYPLVGHLRYLLELVRPELQQYFIERNFDGRPFDRDTRSIDLPARQGHRGREGLRHRARRQRGRLRVPRPRHRAVPVAARAAAGPDRRPALHAALRHGAAQRLGDELRRAVGQRVARAQHRRARAAASPTTPARAASPRYHLDGGDLVWELGSGYFGARTADGEFDPAPVRRQGRPRRRQVRVAQALPGREARHRRRAARGEGQRGDRRSARACRRARRASAPPPTRRSTPRASWCASSRSMRELAGGKPAGIKLCVGSPGRRARRSARRCSTRAHARTSSSSTAPRAAPARRRWSTPTTSARRSPRA